MTSHSHIENALSRTSYAVARGRKGLSFCTFVLWKPSFGTTLNNHRTGPEGGRSLPMALTLKDERTRRMQKSGLQGG